MDRGAPFPNLALMSKVSIWRFQPVQGRMGVGIAWYSADRREILRVLWYPDSDMYWTESRTTINYSRHQVEIRGFTAQSKEVFENFFACFFANRRGYA